MNDPTTAELVSALRMAKSRSRRVLLDEAADRLEWQEKRLTVLNGLCAALMALHMGKTVDADEAAVLDWLGKMLHKYQTSLAKAQEKNGVTVEELDNISDNICIVERLILAVSRPENCEKTEEGGERGK